MDKHIADGIDRWRAEGEQASAERERESAGLPPLDPDLPRIGSYAEDGFNDEEWLRRDIEIDEEFDADEG